MFEKGGKASLLVFASGVDTDVATELRRLRLCDGIALALAALAPIAFGASYFM